MARCPKIEDSNSSTQSVSADEDQRLKILCIHGYRQNGDSFKQKLGAFRKILKKQAKFYFVTAPHPVLPFDPSLDIPINGEAATMEHFGWWFSNDDMSFDAMNETDICVGFQKSWAHIAKLSRDEGPFDGLMGFSQGACLVGILCGMQQREWLDFNFKFAILVAGFKSLSLPHRQHYSDVITIPTLHVYGDNDEVISKEMSEQLTTFFKNPVIVNHPGGHFVPASEKQKTVYLKFLEERLQDREESGSSSDLLSDSDE